MGGGGFDPTKKEGGLTDFWVLSPRKPQIKLKNQKETLKNL